MMTICRDREFLTQTWHDALRVDRLELCRILTGLINAVGRQPQRSL
jgi:hypothetical protein